MTRQLVFFLAGLALATAAGALLAEIRQIAEQKTAPTFASAMTGANTDDALDHGDSNDTRAVITRRDPTVDALLENRGLKTTMQP
jgi:hypothetical protein